jgi:hypothetical protein
MKVIPLFRWIILSFSGTISAIAFILTVLFPNQATTVLTITAIMSLLFTVSTLRFYPTRDAFMLLVVMNITAGCTGLTSRLDWVTVSEISILCRSCQLLHNTGCASWHVGLTLICAAYSILIFFAIRLSLDWEENSEVVNLGDILGGTTSIYDAAVHFVDALRCSETVSGTKIPHPSKSFYS